MEQLTNEALQHFNDIKDNNIKLSSLHYYDEKPKVGEWFFDEEAYNDYGDINIFKILKIRPGCVTNSQGHKQWTTDIFLLTNTQNDDISNRSLKIVLSTGDLGKDGSGKYSTGASKIM